MKMKKRKWLTKAIAVCLSVLLAIPVMSMTCYAKQPTIETSYEELTIGKNQLKMTDYDAGNDTLMGRFVAPEAGKYQISVTNNGGVFFRTWLLNEDLARITGYECGKTESCTFDTISLSKNEAIYVYLESDSASLLAGKVTIKQQSVAPSLNKTGVSLKTKQKVTLKLKNNKDKVTWVSRDPKIASVNSKGVVQAKKKGTTYVYAIAKHKLYKCKVKVYK